MSRMTYRGGFTGVHAALRLRGSRDRGYGFTATRVRLRLYARARGARHTRHSAGESSHTPLPLPPALRSPAAAPGRRRPAPAHRGPCRAGPTHHSPARRGPWHAARGVSGPRSRPIRDCAIARALHCSAFCGGLPRRGRAGARDYMLWRLPLVCGFGREFYDR